MEQICKIVSLNNSENSSMPLHSYLRYSQLMSLSSELIESKLPLNKFRARKECGSKSGAGEIGWDTAGLKSKVISTML